MTGKEHKEKLILAGLGVVCAFMVGRLILGSGGSVPKPSSPPAAPTARAEKSGSKPVGELAQYNPVVRLDVLKDLNDRPLPQLDRDPFEFEPTPQEVAAAKQAEQVKNTPPPPPPPPPIPFKAVGFEQTANGSRAAYLTDDQETYIVHEGEEFAQRFKVVKITSTTVEVADETYHQTAQLPYPQ